MLTGNDWRTSDNSGLVMCFDMGEIKQGMREKQLSYPLKDCAGDWGILCEPGIKGLNIKSGKESYCIWDDIKLQ